MFMYLKHPETFLEGRYVLPYLTNWATAPIVKIEQHFKMIGLELTIFL